MSVFQKYLLEFVLKFQQEFQQYCLQRLLQNSMDFFKSHCTEQKSLGRKPNRNFFENLPRVPSRIPLQIPAKIHTRIVFWSFYRTQKHWKNSWKKSQKGIQKKSLVDCLESSLNKFLEVPRKTKTRKFSGTIPG